MTRSFKNECVIVEGLLRMQPRRLVDVAYIVGSTVDQVENCISAISNNGTRVASFHMVGHTHYRIEPTAPVVAFDIALVPGALAA